MLVNLEPSKSDYICKMKFGWLAFGGNNCMLMLLGHLLYEYHLIIVDVHKFISYTKSVHCRQVYDIFLLKGLYLCS